jgi:hypothetical protein
MKKNPDRHKRKAAKFGRQTMRWYPKVLSTENCKYIASARTAKFYEIICWARNP